MTEKKLEEQLATLAGMPESAVPVVSFYTGLSSGRPAWTPDLGRREERLLRSENDESRRYRLGEAFAIIREYLHTLPTQQCGGVALFSCGGDPAFFLPLQFPDPLPVWLSVDTVPNLCPLTGIAEASRRYALLISTPDNTRIFELNVDPATQDLWVRRPKLRQRLGSVWSRLRYQNHRRERGGRFVGEEIAVIEQLRSEGGPVQVVLVGDADRSAVLQRAISGRRPPPAFGSGPLMAGLADMDKVVASTIDGFVSSEEHDRRSWNERLITALRKDDLAAAGAAEVIEALHRGLADTILISDTADLGRARSCEDCGWSAGEPLPARCPSCENRLLLERDARSTILGLAQAHGCPVETVNGTEAPAGIDGVGCLLRFGVIGEPLGATRSVTMPRIGAV